MRFTRRILQIAIIVLFTAGIPYLGYIVYVSLDRPAKDPVQAIPDRTALIIQVNHPLGLLGELTRNNLIWKELLKYHGVKPIQEQLLLIDSMSRGAPEIRKILKDSPLTITLSVHSRNLFDLLFLIPVPVFLDGKILTDFVGEHYPGKVTVLHSPYCQTQIYRIHFENRLNVLYASVLDGVCIISFTDALVKRAIDKLSLNTPVSVMKGFSTVASTTGKKVDANLYVNFPYLSLALWKGVNENYNKGLVKFAQYADWSGLDLFLKKDELLFNGYTIASDSAMQALALMNYQSPLPLTMARILPSSTQAYLIYALTDYPDHFERWQKRLQRANFSTDDIDLFGELNSRYDTNIRSFLDSWTATQKGRCWIQPSPRDEAISPVTILEVTDPVSARKSLLALSLLSGKKTDSTQYEGVTIYRTGLSEALNLWLTPLFDARDLSWFTIVGEFICVAHDPEVLKQFIDHTLTGDWLQETPQYQMITDNISDHANVSFYCNSRRFLNDLPEILTREYLPLFTPILDSLKKFQSVTMQLSAEEGMFYTNVQIHFNPSTNEKGPLVWQTSLDTLISGTPQIIRAGTGDSFAVLVTDTMNTLYKIGKDGNVLWKQKLYGNVLGSFHEIMLTGNDSLFYLFNTENHLCLIRSDGKLADRFPMKFPVRASNGLSLVTPSNPVTSGTPEEFQVVIAFRNNKIYSFNLLGQLTEGWTSPVVEEEVVLPVKVLGLRSSTPSDDSTRLLRRDAPRNDTGLLRSDAPRNDTGASLTLFVTMRGGWVLITDEFGVQKVKPEKGFSNSPHSTFYFNRTNSKAPWLTTDPDGNVIYLRADGTVNRVTFNNFSDGHYFLYEDIVDDGTPEFIFFDNNTLYYYNRFFKLIYFYSFRHDVSSPNLVKTLHGKTFIGIISPTTNEVFLFDRHGYVEIESGVTGTTPFDIGTLEDRNRLNLVIGAGKTLKAFRLMRI